jgi:hypothetical protein
MIYKYFLVVLLKGCCGKGRMAEIGGLLMRQGFFIAFLFLIFLSPLRSFGGNLTGGGVIASEDKDAMRGRVYTGSSVDIEEAERAERETLSLVGKACWMRQVLRAYFTRDVVEYLVMLDTALLSKVYARQLTSHSGTMEDFSGTLQEVLALCGLKRKFPSEIIEAIRYSFTLYEQPIPLTFFVDASLVPFLGDTSGEGDELLRRALGRLLSPPYFEEGAAFAGAGISLLKSKS